MATKRPAATKSPRKPIPPARATAGKKAAPKPAKAPAKKRPAAGRKKKSPVSPEVSVSLVRETIAALRANHDMVRGLCPPAKKAVPVPVAVLAALRLPDGGELPESLRLWLAYDGRHLDLIGKEGQLRLTTQRAFMKEQLDGVAEVLADDDDFDADTMLEDLLDGEDAADYPAVRLPDSASQAHFLVFDGSEEPPVLGYEKESFWQKYKSFGEFVAHWFGKQQPAHWS